MSAEQTPDIERVLAEHEAVQFEDGGCLHNGEHRAHVAQALAPVLAAAVREEAERIAQAIEKRRNEHWQKHLREHPYADGSSCPGDYAAHDAYYDAARIARADRVAEPQHEAATSGKESEASKLSMAGGSSGAEHHLDRKAAGMPLVVEGRSRVRISPPSQPPAGTEGAGDE